MSAIICMLEAHAARNRKEVAEGEPRTPWTGGSLTGADLTEASLFGASLRGAVLTEAVLTGAVLRGADLSEAVLHGADLSEAVLHRADLSEAVLSGAVLRRADLTGAVLTGATLPDGRTLEEWQADPLAGLCTEPEAVQRAIEAWGNHNWDNCPMHQGLGISSIGEAPADKRALVATFVALFDGRHLPRPR